MADDREFLGRENIGKLLFKLAVPTVFAQLVNMLYNVVDRIYIGHMPESGALALTGVGVCMPLIMVVSAFAALVSSGGAPRSSIAMGQKNYEKAEHILGNCFSLLVMISMVLTTVLLLFNREILLAFGASDNTIGYATSYMRIYAIGTLFVQLTLGMNMFITAQGFAATGMLTVLIGAALNIILDPILIFAFDLGVQGAALATVISQAISCIWCLLFLFGKRSTLKIRRCHMRPRFSILFPCISLGTATFIIQLSESILAVCFNSSLLKYGGDIAVGAMTICTSIIQAMMLPIQGIGQGAQPITSYNYGAKNAERVKMTFALLLKVCFSYATFMYIAIMLFPTLFSRLFSSDAELIEYAGSAIRIYCAGTFLFGIQMSCQLTLTAIGNAPLSILIAVVRKFVLLIPLIFIMPLVDPIGDRALAVYMAEPVADVLAVSFTVVIFSLLFSRSMKRLEG